MDSFLHAEDLNSMARGESGIESGKSRAGLLTGWVALGQVTLPPCASVSCP